MLRDQLRATGSITIPLLRLGDLLSLDESAEQGSAAARQRREFAQALDGSSGAVRAQMDGMAHPPQEFRCLFRQGRIFTTLRSRRRGASECIAGGRGGRRLWGDFRDACHQLVGARDNTTLPSAKVSSQAPKIT